MKITLLTVGKLKEKYLKDGIKEYIKRLGIYTKIVEIEVKDEKAPENLSENEMEIIKEKEAHRLLEKIKDTSYVISLAIEGESLSSVDFAKKIDSLMLGGKSDIVFIIGGSLGLHKSVLERSNAKISFSKLTFPHQLMKLILVEQIYRAYRIINNHSYHK